MNFWYGLMQWAANGVVIIFGLLGILGAILLSVLKIQHIAPKNRTIKEDQAPAEEPETTEIAATGVEATEVAKYGTDNENRQKKPSAAFQIAAIIMATTLSCFFMIFVVSAFNNIVKMKVEQTVINEQNAEIIAIRADIDRRIAVTAGKETERENKELRIKTMTQDIVIKDLNDRVSLLNGAGLSVQSFKSIAELALLQADLSETTYRREPLPSASPNVSYKDEMLAIFTHDISATFGIDLNEVKIIKLSDDTVAVSGIKSRFIAARKNDVKDIVSEIRRVNYNRNGDATDISKLNTSAAARLAYDYSDRYKEEFQHKFESGEALEYMDSAVVQLAQNFLEVMLVPLYANVRFMDRELQGSLPMVVFLQNEIAAIENRIELIEIQAEPLMVIVPEEDAQTPNASFEDEEEGRGIGAAPVTNG
ncbi:MAG: hypothetical protein LBH43_05775 [Treponema sp.]|jgi:low affinity Fe/Cu permease|nr:hypothetical protein [Treponema sp.]